MSDVKAMMKAWDRGREGGGGEREIERRREREREREREVMLCKYNDLLIHDCINP